MISIEFTRIHCHGRQHIWNDATNNKNILLFKIFAHLVKQCWNWNTIHDNSTTWQNVRCNMCLFVFTLYLSCSEAWSLTFTFLHVLFWTEVLHLQTNSYWLHGVSTLRFTLTSIVADFRKFYAYHRVPTRLTLLTPRKPTSDVGFRTPLTKFRATFSSFCRHFSPPRALKSARKVKTRKLFPLTALC